MCGIIGINSVSEISVSDAIKKLKKLEYRGYDSFGYYYDKKLFKKTGEIVVPDTKDRTKLIIAHSRWATHGGVTELNAHPHQSCDKKVTIVHNGIIENYVQLKADLIKKGHKFISETDTEVIAHYIEEKLKTKKMLDICVDFIKDMKGEFAIVAIVEGDNNLYSLRRGSPLVLGVCKGYNILASDIYAFSDSTDKAIFFEDDEFAVITPDRYTFYNSKGNEVKKKIQIFKWEQEESTTESYKHFMIKEIMEQPKVVKRLLLSLKIEQKDTFAKFVKMIKDAKKVTFVAAGSSYHASLLGVYYLHKCGIDAQTIIASEFEHFVGVDKNTLVIALSQSGETMDVIEALKYAQKNKAKIASIVNVPYSTIQRMSEITLNILAGQEVCVAATKSFVNQVTMMLSIAQAFGFKINLENLPEKITEVLEQKEDIEKIAEMIYRNHDIYILGRGLSYPVAREMALKIKEISYVHAEGMMGGELKHGTIALIEKGTPVISLISGKDYSMVSSTKEVEARGARVIRITNELEGDIKINTANDGKFGILATVVGQLLTYYMAILLNRNPDRPRNLAKAVTVK
jgi:glucosamine--fructose-6-phosphate aminotransferase (isomerizing)